MDSKDVLLDALEDFGGTLILVSHDRYFIDKLATKIVDLGGGGLIVYPGGYEEYRWSREHQQAVPSPAPPGPGQTARPTVARPGSRPTPAASRVAVPAAAAGPAVPEAGVPVRRAPVPDALSREQKKQVEAEQRRHRRAVEALRVRVAELEARIAEREAAIKDLEATMAAPGFYANHDTSRPVLDRHQALMWDVGDLMNQWEMLQQEIEALDTNAPKPPAVS
jgi:ATP-binding cassette subfamily F protein 3